MKYFIALLIFGLFSYTGLKAQSPANSGSETVQMDSTSIQKIILFHNDGCGKCHVAKEFLDENEIPYLGKNIGVAENRSEMQQWVNKARNNKAGGFSYPVIVLNEDSVYYSIPNIHAFLDELKIAWETGKL